MTKSHTENAVSPVVGVMLMLVVTIIIAAVVAAFSGSLAQTNNKPPQANIQGTLHVNGSTGSIQNGGNGIPNVVVLTHMGGDELATANIQIVLKKGDEWTEWGGQLSPTVLTKSQIYNSAGTYWTNATWGGSDVNVWLPGQAMYYSISGYTSSNIGQSLTLEVETTDGKLISTSKMPIVT
jgi:FlaG/FlaF family flagellin (archaellin)